MVKTRCLEYQKMWKICKLQNAEIEGLKILGYRSLRFEEITLDSRIFYFKELSIERFRASRERKDIWIQDTEIDESIRISECKVPDSRNCEKLGTYILILDVEVAQNIYTTQILRFP